MYIYLMNDTAIQNIPEEHPDFPGIPVEQRYTADFLAKCVKWPEEVPQGYLWDGAQFNPPPEPEPAEMEPMEPAPGDPSFDAQAAINALDNRLTETQLAIVEVYEFVLSGGI